MVYKTVQELVDTETTTAGIADITPEVWSDELEAAAQPLRVARNFIKVNMDLLNKPGDIVHIMKSGTLIASTATEATAITPQAMDGYSTVDLTPAEIGAGVAISRDVVEEVKVDILKDATLQLAEALATKEDTDIYVAMDVSGPTILYGGDATSCATLAAGDKITTDLFANAVSDVRGNNYKPDVLFINPVQENVFLKDGQFVNASEYGGDTIVKNGEIGTYLGVKVVSSTQVIAYAATATDPADSTSWAVDGHSAYMVDSSHAAVMAVKRNATIETEYNPSTRMHEIYATMKYDADILNDGAVCLIKVADA